MGPHKQRQPPDNFVYIEVEIPGQPGCYFVINRTMFIGVKHPECLQLADISIELDAFYCTSCRFSGRISGAWVADMTTPESNGETRSP